MARSPENTRSPFTDTGAPGREGGRAEAQPSASRALFLLPHGCADSSQGLLPSHHLNIPATSRTCPGPSGWHEAKPWTPACEQTTSRGASGFEPGWHGRRKGHLGGRPPPGLHAGISWHHLASPEDGTLVQVVLQASSSEDLRWEPGMLVFSFPANPNIGSRSRAAHLESTSASAVPLGVC